MTGSDNRRMRAGVFRRVAGRRGGRGVGEHLSHPLLFVALNNDDHERPCHDDAFMSLEGSTRHSFHNCGRKGCWNAYLMVFLIGCTVR